MKVCPKCNTPYEYEMSFCLQDGTPLVLAGSTSDATQIIENNPPDSQITQIRGDQNLQIDDRTLNLPNQGKEPLTEEPTLFTPGPGSSPTERMNFVNTGEGQQATDKMKVEVPTREPRHETIFSEPLPSSSRTGWVMAIILGVIAVFAIPIIGLILLNPFAQKDEIGRTNSNRSSSNQSFSSSNTTNTNSSNSSNSNAVNTFGSNSSSVVSPSNIKTNSTNSLTQTNANKIINRPATPEITNSKPTTPPPASPPITNPTTRPVPKVVSGGVVNGKAISLVKPPYPPAARAVRASGAVNVQVLIDENGNVVSASAISGHALLRAAAESAARASKFSPTVLAGQPVKVTGVIIYNFTAQ